MKTHTPVDPLRQLDLFRTDPSKYVDFTQTHWSVEVNGP